jgi:hypothetical protein
MTSSTSARSRFEIYCDILYRGLITIRSSSNKPELVSVHSDHIHNIPSLLKNIDDEELHRFYWKCMRINYDREDRKDWPRVFDELWSELADATKAEAGYDPRSL